MLVWIVERFMNKKPSYSFLVIFLLSSFVNASEQTANNAEGGKTKFFETHSELLPVVTVADMFFGCNLERKIDNKPYLIKELVTVMSREELSQKLITCLGTDGIKSSKAMDFGLVGCFHDQLLHLPIAEQKSKMALVLKAIQHLSLEEKQQSLTRCINEQTIHYIKY